MIKAVITNVGHVRQALMLPQEHLINVWSVRREPSPQQQAPASACLVLPKVQTVIALPQAFIVPLIGLPVTMPQVAQNVPTVLILTDRTRLANNVRQAAKHVLEITKLPAQIARPAMTDIL